MTLETFKKKLKETPRSIEFSETMEVIDQHYGFRPTAFRNGELYNEIGQNSGSCKLFAFARKQGLAEEETLACFGRYYFEEVLPNPNGTDHRNIRNFIKTGFGGIVFEEDPLTEK